MRARTDAVLAGWAVTTSVDLDASEPHDHVSLHARDPEGCVLHLSWTVTDGRTVVHARRTVMEGERRPRSTAELLSHPRAQVIPVDQALAELARPVAQSQEHGPCACCERTAPETARLRRTVLGLCHPCDTWHRRQLAPLAPLRLCQHSGLDADRRPSRWWREDPATEPSWHRNPLMAQLFAESGEDVEHASTAQSETWWGANGVNSQLLIEVTHDLRSGSWTARATRAPWAGPSLLGGRPVTWSLRPDIAAHEVLEAFRALQDGQRTCPEHLGAAKQRQHR